MPVVSMMHLSQRRVSAIPSTRLPWSLSPSDSGSGSSGDEIAGGGGEYSLSLSMVVGTNGLVPVIQNLSAISDCSWLPLPYGLGIWSHWADAVEQKSSPTMLLLCQVDDYSLCNRFLHFSLLR